MYPKSPDTNLLLGTLASKDSNNVVRTQAVFIAYLCSPGRGKRSAQSSRFGSSELPVEPEEQDSLSVEHR